MPNSTMTASASHRPLPSIFDLAEQFQAERNMPPTAQAPAGQSISGTATTSAVSYRMDPQPAANEPIPWDADAWLSAFGDALDAEDSDQQNALAVLAQQAMADAQQRGDTAREQSISAAAIKARNARDEAAEEARAQQPTVPNVEMPFGAGAVTLPLTQASTGQQVAPATAGKPKIDYESRELLRYISEDFVMWASGSKLVAYHIESGDELGEKGFEQYCAKHYGDVLYITQDKDGKDVEQRVPAGKVWWQWNEPQRRVVRRIVMEPTSKPELEDNPEAFNRWHVLKHTMAERNMSATRADIQILANHLMYLSDGDVVGVAFFLCWLAQLYQTPEIKMPTAQTLYSKHGRVGKNLMQRLISKVFGKPLVASCTGKMLQKNFDDAIEHKRIVFINELARSDRADGYENFKSQVSEEDTQFEGKGRASKEIRNIAHYIITTNHEDALPLMENDGRIAVLRCTSERQSDAYYKTLVEWIDGPGAPALANVLATWEFPAGWDPYAPVPQTAAAKAMQKAARGDLACTLEVLSREGAQPFDKDCGRVMAMIAILDTAHSAALRGIKVNHRTLPAALERLGAVQIGSGTASKDSAWFWRNQDYWASVPTAVLLAYIRDSIIPDDYPKTEVSDHE